MKTLLRFAIVIVCSTLAAVAQQGSSSAIAGSAPLVPPPLIQFSGIAQDEGGTPFTGALTMIFSLYPTRQGGQPLWTENQTVQLDGLGHYSVQLGLTRPGGVPAALFTGGEARWLGVRIQGQEEQPRTLLVSVPYAMKAGDAATLGGLPPSAFVLATPTDSFTATVAGSNFAAAPTAAASPAAISNVTTTGGTPNAISMFSSATKIQNSLLTQTGTSAINVGGKLNLPATGTATASKFFNSQPLDFVASAYNTTTNTAVPQTFQWQAEAVNNDKTTATGTLNLLYALGTAAPVETGLQISSKGLFTFAPGQAFPGVGTIMGVTTAAGSGLTGGGTSGTLNLGLTHTCTANQVLKWNGSAWECSSTGTGTVTSVASGSGLTGGPITGSGTLSIAAGGVSNAMLANPSLTVKAGTGLTGGGTVTLGGSTTLNVDTSKIPQLASSNAFTAPMAVTESSAQAAVTGTQTAASGITYGVEGIADSNSTNAAGVYGIAAGSGLNFGVEGVTNSNSKDAAGVYGSTGSSSGQAHGVLGTTNSANGNGVSGLGVMNGVFGLAAGVSGVNYGVYGTTDSPSGYGVYSAGNAGVNGNLSVTGTESVTGNLSATGSLSGGELTSGDTVNSVNGYLLGGMPFAFGQPAPVYNAFLGFAGPSSKVIGNQNTGVGVYALHANVGDSAGDGSQNTAVGSGALASNNATTGGGLSAIGNTAVGYYALANNTTGSQNTASGEWSGYSNGPTITGSFNTFLGFQSALSAGNLNYATAIGANSEVSASNSLVLGSISGTNGCNSPCANTKVGIGTTAPAYTLDVSYGDMIVRGVQNFPLAGETANLYVGDTNHIIQAVNAQGINLGTNAHPYSLVVSDSGSVGIETSSGAPTQVFTVGQSTGHAIADGWDTYSSRRWKNNIQTLHGALAKVEQLRGVTYDLKDSGKHEIGVIAEEVGSVVPEVVSYEDNGKDARGVDYSRLTALLIEATKEQQKLILQQQEQIRLQQAQIARLGSQVKAIQTALGSGGRTDSAAHTVKAKMFVAHQ